MLKAGIVEDVFSNSEGLILDISLNRRILRLLRTTSTTEANSLRTHAYDNYKHSWDPASPFPPEYRLVSCFESNVYLLRYSSVFDVGVLSDWSSSATHKERLRIRNNQFSDTQHSSRHVEMPGQFCATLHHRILTG